MPEITVLPPQEVPTQLTARSVIDTLGEHWSAFLAANNLSGWTEDDDYVLRADRFADVLLSISSTTGMYVSQFKRQAARLKALSLDAGSKVKLTAVNEIIARALGYDTYYMAYKCRTVDDFIQNVWPVGAVLSLSIMEAESLNASRHSKTINELADRYRFNMIRDGKANELDANKLRVDKRHRERKVARHNPLTFRSE